jgi:uncharacterized protein (DUF433 family)
MSEYRGIYIVCDPLILSGRPTIQGHRIAVHDIAALHQRGETPDQIAAGYQLSLRQVLAALDYYREHQEQIDRDLREDQIEIARRAAADASPETERLRKALRSRRASSRHG